MARSGNIRKLKTGFAGAAVVALTFLGVSSIAVEQPSEVLLPELHSPLGNYLAGRVARTTNDAYAAAYYLGRAFDATDGDETVIDDAFESLLLSGNIRASYALAKSIADADNDKSGFARLVLGVAAFAAGEFETAIAYLDDIQVGTVGHLAKPMVRGWAVYASEGVDAATTYLQAERSGALYGPYHDFHAALMRDIAGDERASEISYLLVLNERGRRLPRVVEAYGRHLARNDQRQDALALYADFRGKFPMHPILSATFEAIEAGERPDLMVRTAQEGVAEGLFGIAELVLANRFRDVAQMLLNISLELRPDNSAAQELLANLLEVERRYAQANEVYGRIAKGTPLYRNAQREIAYNLTQMDEHAAAYRILDALLDENEKDAEVLRLYGDILREQERYEESIPYYNLAVENMGDATARDWRLFYVRGIAYERIGDWRAAERSFLKALELNPDQPSVLNYLGYTWVEQGGRLGEATAYIERAVRIRPNDGYFVDSLGWAQFQAGDYEDAVSSLERAIHLTPQDAVINEHLGDAYWHVGRQLEARFQWRHSLALNPEEEQLEGLRQKLRSGL